ncbi:MAG: 2OG-Fe(II) oxygenase family protein, partial [Chromatiales bacterium]
GLSRNWQNEWGGLLHFLGGDDRVEDVLAPEFNTISLFRVPQRHFVSQVAAFAGEQRISITGWARSK